MTIIRQQDVINSVSEALQYISYYHPEDFISAMGRAYEVEESPAAKAAIAQILYNSKLCAEGKRPICQDTGMVVVFVEVGMDIRWEGNMSLEEMINEGVRRAYTYEKNILRYSVVEDPIFTRKNTKDNTPAVIHTSLVKGDKLDITVAAKGAGSENKSKFTVLNPSDSLVDWVLKVVPTMGAGWCPPGMLGIGIGGTAEKAILLAKESLMEEIDIHEIKTRGASTPIEKLRLELYEKVNALGIGAQGLGGITTVLDVKIKDFPTHAASLPVAIIPNCAATRHLHFTLDGKGGADIKAPDLSAWPNIKELKFDNAKEVNLDTLTQEEIETWKSGDTLLLSGTILTGRDAAHKKMTEMFAKGEKLPDGVNFDNKLIYYVGPVDAIEGEVVGPAGPTTSTRMDKFTESMLNNTGLLGMIGKAERGDATISLLKKHKKVYLIAVGGAAYLVSKAISKSKVIAFHEIGMEAIHEFVVDRMPVSVAVDTSGVSVHKEGPKKYSKVIAKN